MCSSIDQDIIIRSCNSLMFFHISLVYKIQNKEKVVV